MRGARGVEARDRLIDYYKGTLTRESKIGQGDPRPDFVNLYLDPFSLPLATDHTMRDTALAPAWNTLRAIAPTQQHVTATLGTDTPVRVKSYKAPRITRIQLDRTGTLKRSEITNLQYLKYDHTSMSIPFGKNLTNDTVAGVAAELIAAYTTAPGFSARLIPERA
ncbi:hypothetical protein [Nodosilinea sp. PGN35]|uniref:hypothetical protein n=1 Tax=Nodosilinea sp. PGN35 TaxID=3020489 RepID=UPI0023B230A8|nr:hypothetical protein [Nodosilinea sp. TSF1-S3]MDF0367444.1 hypothetical protein [Nodosilinea sp. TSF1-S3]